MYRLASSEETEFIVVVYNRDNTLAGPFNFTLSASSIPASSALAEVEPNDLAQPTLVTTAPSAYTGTLGVPDTEDVYQLDLKAGQRVWVIAAATGMTGPYDLNMSVSLVDPQGNEDAIDGFSGEGFFGALEGLTVEHSGLYKFRASIRDTSNDVGDYVLYFFAEDVVEVADVEPNNVTAQDLGVLAVNTIVRTTTDAAGGGDDADVFSFTLTEASRVRVLLDRAADGHTLSLSDAQGQLIAASGPNEDARDQPVLAELLAPGTYTLTLSAAPTASTADVLLFVEPVNP